MDHFVYQQDQLFCEQVPVRQIAEKVGTPFYLYSATTLREKYTSIRDAFKEVNPLICFSMKTNNNLTLLRELIQLGSGIDTVSGGEIHLALKAGVAPEKIVYAGIGKTKEEITYAIDNNIGLINIESEQEFELVAQIAKAKNKTVRTALRVTPDVVDEKTHNKTKTGYKGSKFGVDIEDAKDFFAKHSSESHVQLCGIHAHIGSPIYSPEPYVKAIGRLIELVEYLKAKGNNISMIDIGGGFPTDYIDHKSPEFSVFAAAIVPLLAPYVQAGVQIILEPGRSIVGNAGIVVSAINYIKESGGKKFAILDTGMSHLIRPALYDADHFIWPVKSAPSPALAKRTLPSADAALQTYDIVGPICESSDYLAKNRHLPALAQGDLLAIFTAGAYGFSMASQYNAIPRPAEIMVDGDKVLVIREKETYDDVVYKVTEKQIQL